MHWSHLIKLGESCLVVGVVGSDMVFVIFLIGETLFCRLLFTAQDGEPDTTGDDEAAPSILGFGTYLPLTTPEDLKRLSNNCFNDCRAAIYEYLQAEHSNHKLFTM